MSQAVQFLLRHDNAVLFAWVFAKRGFWAFIRS